MGSLYGVDNTGLISTAAGIDLPTTGGIQATLDYYEESTALTLTLTGPWGATSSTLPVTFTRVGNIVVMEWADSSPATRAATTTSTITTSTGTAIPAKFQPSIGIFTMPVINALATSTGSFGSFFFTSGVLTITSAINAQFTSGNNVGVIGGSVSYLS
jgi:hypothetical protein